MVPSLQLQQLTVKYGARVVLNQVDLTIQPGETVAIIGESGSGKSTLLAQLRQRYPDDIAWCPQSPGLVPMLSLYHNVYMGRLHQRPLWRNIRNLIAPKPADVAEIRALTDQLALTHNQPERLQQAAEQFSGGEQQRIGIARALYQQRSVFVGDEPVSAVDELHAPRLIEQIKSQHQTVVLALHDVDLALNCCDRIIGLVDGNIAIDAASNRVKRSDVLAAYPHEKQ